MKNNFDKGPEGWCSYDYHASMVADGSNIFILATWTAQGGVDGSICCATTGSWPPGLGTALASCPPNQGIDA